jgi:signal transduction histidine kinase
VDATRSAAPPVSLFSRIALVFSIAFLTGPLLLIGQWALERLADGSSPGVIAFGGIVGAILSALAAYAVGAFVAAVVLRPLNRDIELVQRATTLRDMGAILLSVQTVELHAVTAATVRIARSHDARQRGRTAFLAALMHDLKTRLVGMALLLRDGQPLCSLDVDAVRSELTSIQAWLAGALDAVRLDQVERLVRREPVDMRRLIDEVTARSAATDSSLAHVTVEGSATANVDRVEFARALTNLVDNARRAARSNVAVEIYPGLIRVSDDGAGLPAPLEELTQPFLRVEGGEDRLTTTGTGLGLFVARRVVELHGGRLVCERSDPTGTVLLAYVGK